MVQDWLRFRGGWRLGAGGRRGLIAGGAVVVLVVGAGLGAKQVAFSQQPEVGDVQARSVALLDHLSDVIQFYQTTRQPIQTAGEPNDVVYRDQATELAAEVAGYAFQSAKAQAAYMAAHQGGANAGAGDGGGEQQKLQAAATNVDAQLADLKNQITAVDQQIAVAKPKAVAGLQAQKKNLEGALDLTNAMKDALGKIVGMAGTGGGSGLAGDIARLQSSVPELQSKNKVASSLLMTTDAAGQSGVTTQASVLIDLLETRHSLAVLLTSEDDLHKQATNLRTPLVTVLRGLIQQGQQISQGAANGGVAGAPTQGNGAGNAPAGSNGAAGGQMPIQTITKQFKVLSAATIPLSQEIIVLEQSRSNLLAWQTSVNEEYSEVLHALLWRIAVILVALGLILGGGKIWAQATNKYVQDIRRRRQLLIVRRVVMGFLSVIVIVFGFVTQFNSLATFAGFITAGIAVGLQTILLSVAAYFFIIGRYGIKVGDRITIAAVTGDVIDVGLVRFYMMELAGTGSELNPTGRVAVFSNAVLFQAGTPLYKQIPGTRFAWHELTVKLADGADYKLITEAVLKEVQAVYETHRGEIEQQHKGLEDQMQIPMNAPGVESRIQLTGGALQLWVRFPVSIQHAAEMDEQLTEGLMELAAKSPEVKAGVAGTPVIAASVRG
jgi:small-conductance mechanosensitive channel